MSGAPADGSRLASARRVLRERGVPAVVRAAGEEGEIAVLRVSEAEWERVLGGAGEGVVAELKALGFRFVALDLATDADEG